jgi:signal transduction histidine kinase/DNA-binding NarL/FixJ family response regulator
MSMLRGYYWRCFVLGAAGLALALLVGLTPLARDIDLKLGDALLSLSAPVGDFSEVVVVDVDEPSMARLQSQIGAWPYNRDIYALVTPYLLKAGAKSVAYDILFSEPRAGDDEFAAALSSKVVLAAASLPFGGAAHDANYRQRLANSAWAHGPSWLTQVWDDLTLPLSKFDGKAAVGVISMAPDSDGTFRRIPLLHRAYGEVLPSLSVATLKASGLPVQLDQTARRVVVNGVAIPTDTEGLARLRFPRNFNSLRIIPFYEVALAASGSANYAGLAESFKGKMVYLGSSSAVLGDFHQTPLGQMAGLHLTASLPVFLKTGLLLTPRSWLLDGALTLLLLTLALLAAHPLLQASGALQVLALPGLILITAFVVSFLGAFSHSAGMLLPALTALFVHVGAVIWRQLHLYRKSRQLMVEKLAAEEATRLKSQFLSHITHELRTPLTAILGFNNINWKTDTMGRDERVKNSEVIDRNGRHLLALINGILDQAQLEAGQVRIVTQPESLRVLVGDVVATLKPLVRDKAVALEATYASGMPEAVEIDAFRVRQILLNLAGNAIKFTEHGQVVIQVAWSQGMLTITVADTGPGLSAQAQSRLFAPFSQADDTIAAKHGGTGLGLTISRDLAGLMLGEITLTSQLGVGSQFTLRLPASAGQLSASPAQLESATGSPSGSRSVTAPAPLSMPTPLSGASGSTQSRTKSSALHGTILVAEDADDLRALSVLYLKRLGLTVLEAANGREAVELALKGAPDAILMDLEMPIMGGLEAVKNLRERGYSRPILATTAHAGEPHRTLALAAGCNDLLSKPISYAVLRAALDGAMSARLLAQRADNGSEPNHSLDRPPVNPAVSLPPQSLPLTSP